MTDITFGSVCTGIGAPEVAWTPLGWRPVWFAEIENFPSKLLAYRYPHVPNLGDMTQIASYVRAGIVTAPDVLVGGTPCQAFSVAGVRAGLADPRGQLTLSFVDLANAIDEQRTGDECVVYWENVPGVLSDKGNAFGCFLGLLAGEDCELVPPGKSWPNAGCVYGPQRAIAWRVLDAQYFGVAQRRRRVFVVASARKGFDPSQLLFEFDGLRRDSAPSRETGQETAGTLASRTHAGGFPGTDKACSGYLQPVRCYGGGKRSGSLEVAACLTARGQRIDFEVETFAVQYAPEVSPCLQTTRDDYSRADGFTAIVQSVRPAVDGLELLTFHAEALPDQMRFDPHTTAALTCSQRPAIAFSCKDSGNDASIELATTMRAMGHGTSHANAGGQLAVCVTGDITHTLKAEGFDASEAGTGRGQPIVASAMRVRRLMPIECERLQAFPDRYTLIPIRKLKPARAAKLRALGEPVVQIGADWWELSADGPRYKALGNSMCVYVMAWLGARLMLTYPDLFARRVPLAA